MEKQTKVRSRQEIADQLNISRWTLNRWLKNAGIQLTNGFLSPKEQELIYQKFGISETEVNNQEPVRPR